MNQAPDNPASFNNSIPTKLASLGLELPEPVAPLASYVPVVVAERAGLVFVSGQIPARNGRMLATGQVGDGVSLEQARSCAQQCVLNALAAVKRELGSFDQIGRVLKLEGFVACGAGFGKQPEVINGASDLLLELFGEAGRHARAAVGVTSLPRDVPVEIAFVFELA